MPTERQRTNTMQTNVAVMANQMGNMQEQLDKIDRKIDKIDDQLEADYARKEDVEQLRKILFWLIGYIATSSVGFALALFSRVQK